MSRHEPHRHRFPAAGDVVDGKYRVRGILGSGGMGVVLSAEHGALGKQVALKMIRPDVLAGDPSLLARFLREARAAAALESEHIARLVDRGTDAFGTPYLVVEYLEGIDLASLLAARGPLPWPEAASYMMQACVGLAEAHARGIVHRDLKPSNLFRCVNEDGAALLKILDFGIAKVTRGDGSCLSGSCLTNDERILGSPRYMAPEQVRAPANVDGRADIWSLGVLVYELLAGTPPFRGKSLGEILDRVLHEDPRPICELRPDLPAAIAEIVGGCLHKQRARRAANVVELLESLTRAGAPEGGKLVARARALERSVHNTRTTLRTEPAVDGAMARKSRRGPTGVSAPVESLDAAPLAPVSALRSHLSRGWSSWRKRSAGT